MIYIVMYSQALSRLGGNLILENNLYEKKN